MTVEPVGLMVESFLSVDHELRQVTAISSKSKPIPSGCYGWDLVYLTSPTKRAFRKPITWI